MRAANPQERNLTKTEGYQGDTELGHVDGDMLLRKDTGGRRGYAGVVLVLLSDPARILRLSQRKSPDQRDAANRSEQCQNARHARKGWLRMWIMILEGWSDGCRRGRS
jgi:hypothetical protein